MIKAFVFVLLTTQRINLDFHSKHCKFWIIIIYDSIFLGLEPKNLYLKAVNISEPKTCPSFYTPNENSG